ncbi:transposase [Ruminiclostridium sufflavum DSM 19573]|uniref:Transposase n=1 Tax=Ruminiclostridium sufflavum DSM 19573 TaxID=1121337 RepID=A0A318XFG6_9FIRM|nr:IS21 family transposase [Ruminiclostridium sufflavum]PYG83886.1 transposase [Ruminiclostridium sufflavum DSM 19573]
MTNYKEILRLSNLGINNSQIAASCGCSRTTVVTVLQKATEQRIDWQTAVDLSNKEIYKRLFPIEGIKPTYKMPDYEYIHREMAKSGVTLTLLWVEYCEKCREAGETPYKSTQFNKYYSDFVKSTKATMHINRKPGEIMEVDWAGQTAEIIDTDTGEIIPAYVFVAALPYSGYAYVEAFLSQKQESWITAHINAYKFFGGVTRILVPDNLKTGVEKASRHEPVINKTYQEMAKYYGTAVIPARIKSPKDKPTVEGSVGIISTWILAAIRNQQFLSLRELNAAIIEKLHVFNRKPFQKKDGSRATVFIEEKPFLLPLSAKPFELATWKIATVQYNYHIAVENQNYSVPYEYIRQKVDVRITRNVIEVFFEGHRISSHPRLYGRNGQYSTIEAHMPPDHQKYVSWNGERFRIWAGKIGTNTATVVNSFLTSHKVEQQGYKSCMVLLKLADKYSIERLEAACTKAIYYTPVPSLKSIQAILKSGQDKAEANGKPAETPSKTSEYGFTRGAEYYRRDGKC